MTAEQYVNDITGRVKCSGKRRKEIKKELMSEINAHIEEGMSLEEALSQIGSVSDVADDFNDNMSETEKKKYSAGRMLTIIIPICIFLFILIGGVIFVIPRQKDISQSKVFSRDQVISRIQKDIGLLNAGDYENLRAGSSEAMNNVLKDGLMESIQQQTGGNWGSFVSFGEDQIVELTQAGQHYAVAEIQAVYENISVIYRITYDKDMMLSGLYVR